MAHLSDVGMLRLSSNSVSRRVALETSSLAPRSRRPNRFGLAFALGLLLLGAGPSLQGLSPPSAKARDLPRPEVPRLATPVAVFGADDRVNVPSRLEWIAQRIGILFNNEARTVCTAFCVADNVIATAAHCFARGQTPLGARYSDFNFVRNYDRSKTFVRLEGGTNGSIPQHVTTGDFRMRVRPPIDAANDWALARVPRNTCPTDSLKVKPLPIEQLVEAGNARRIFQISYHRDWAQWRPAYSKPCSIARDYEQAKWQAIAPDFMKADQMVLHTCDTGGASSGSPLFLETPDGVAVVAINVGTYVQSKITTEAGQAPVRQRSETIANTAVNAAAFVERIPMLQTASIVASGPPMRELQEGLRALGHYTGRIDGTYGPAMRAAIESFEASVQLPVTGLATQALASQVRAAPQGAVAPASAPDASVPSAGSRR